MAGHTLQLVWWDDKGPFVCLWRTLIEITIPRNLQYALQILYTAPIVLATPIVEHRPKDRYLATQLSRSKV